MPLCVFLGLTKGLGRTETFVYSTPGSSSFFWEYNASDFSVDWMVKKEGHWGTEPKDKSWGNQIWLEMGCLVFRLSVAQVTSTHLSRSDHNRYLKRALTFQLECRGQRCPSIG